MKKFQPIIVLFLCVFQMSFSQGKFVIQNNKGTDRIKFKFINNLIIIPVEINGVKLSFLLDTGVSKPIIFNFLNITDSLKIKNAEKIYLRGLGEGESVEAMKSRNNVLSIGDAIKLNQDIFAVYDASLNFAPRLGVPVHGIIGYDIFKDFVVEINYGKNYIRLTDPEKYEYKECRKCERLNLEFYNNKPYINAKVRINNKDIFVKLLIDSGGSDAIWLFEDKAIGVALNKKYFNDFLGHGLSGSVYGRRSKLDEFSLKSFVLRDANVAFPDSASIQFAKQFKGRNGSVAGNILKRFNIIVDYRRAVITLKKNSYYNDDFSYNKSGIELEHSGLRFVKEKDFEIKQDYGTLGDETSQNNRSNIRIVFDPKYKLSLKSAFAIVELRKGSAADKAGLKIGDMILKINGRHSFEYSLQQITYMFYGKEGKRFKMKVDRDGDILDFEFRLEKLF